MRREEGEGKRGEGKGNKGGDKGMTCDNCITGKIVIYICVDK